MKKKIGIVIDDNNYELLQKVGDLNDCSVSECCRLIIENQLTFFLKTKQLPVFKTVVQFGFKKIKDEPDVGVAELNPDIIVGDQVFCWEREDIEQEEEDEEALPF